jgi:hypothetical protein
MSINKFNDNKYFFVKTLCFGTSLATAADKTKFIVSINTWKPVVVKRNNFKTNNGWIKQNIFQK